MAQVQGRRALSAFHLAVGAPKNESTEITAASRSVRAGDATSSAKQTVTLVDTNGSRNPLLCDALSCTVSPELDATSCHASSASASERRPPLGPIAPHLREGVAERLVGVRASAPPVDHPQAE